MFNQVLIKSKSADQPFLGLICFSGKFYQA